MTPVADDPEEVSIFMVAPLRAAFFFANSAWSFARSSSVAISSPDTVELVIGA
jgi:hypothetical protein